MTEIIYTIAKEAAARYFDWFRSAYAPSEYERQQRLALEISRAIAAAIAEKERE